MHASIQETERSIHSMAARDMDAAMASKQRVDQTMEEVQRINSTMEKGVEELGCIACRVEFDVNTAVTALQLQDMATPLLNHARKRVDEIQESLGDVARRPAALTRGAEDLNGDGSPQPADAPTPQAPGRLEEARSRTARNPVRQEEMASGEIELF